jgi:hypothetical protein
MKSKRMSKVRQRHGSKSSQKRRRMRNLRKTRRGGKERDNKERDNKERDNKERDSKAKVFKKAQCAPNAKNEDIQNYSCYSEADLIKMKNLWNARHRDMPIAETIPHDIWASLKAKMENACHTEACWLKQKFMENNLSNELNTYTFAPKSPEKWKENHNTWLNSTDIERVMKQYEHTFPCFRFIGPTPIDFDTQLYDDKCVWDELCNFELAKYIKDGVNKIGVIFNTDPHTKGGAHWISLFINLKKKFIFFFDSNGTKIPKEIDAFCKRIMTQAEDIGLTLTMDQNAPFAHQEGNTECGMYSLYLIITLLRDKHPYKFFQETKISDAAMEKMRDTYFNPE